jgi:hypothetical protein
MTLTPLTVERQDRAFLDSSLDIYETSVDAPDPWESARPALRATAEEIGLDSGREDHGWRGGLLLPQERAFWHDRWAATRAAAIQALGIIQAKPSRIERFIQCGAGAVLQYNPKLEQHRIQARFCRDRLCPHCGHVRSLKVARWIKSRLEDDLTRHIVLSIKHTPQPLGEQVTHLWKSFRRLRQHTWWKQRRQSGIGVMEIKYTAGRNPWHPHLHIISQGMTLTHRDLSAAWRAASRGSFCVWIRPIEPDGKELWYVAKYASKPMDKTVALSPGRLARCARDLAHRRLHQRYGTWEGSPLESRRHHLEGWHLVSSLADAIDAAGREEVWAVAALKAIGREIPVDIDGEECEWIGDTSTN